MITLRNITEENFDAVLDLHLTVEDRSFVDSVEYSLAEAWLYYEYMRPFVIYRDEEIIGFVSMYVEKDHYQIINFFIEDAFRNKSYGTEAARRCIDYLRQHYDARQTSLPVKLENNDAKRFWARLGFQESNTIEEGYVFMRKILS